MAMASTAPGWNAAVAEPTPYGEIAMVVATVAVAGYLYFSGAGSGNENYPGPWSYTVPDRSGPFFNPPTGYDLGKGFQGKSFETQFTILDFITKFF